MDKKRVLLDVVKIFQEFSDREHGLSRRDIEAHLRSRDVFVERRTLYRNIQEINDYGIMKITYDGKRYFRSGAIDTDSAVNILEEMKENCSENSCCIVRDMIQKELSNYQKLEMERRMK